MQFIPRLCNDDTSQVHNEKEKEKKLGKPKVFMEQIFPGDH
jgi:hypothetical protein